MSHIEAIHRIFHFEPTNQKKEAFRMNEPQQIKIEGQWIDGNK